MSTSPPPNLDTIISRLTQLAELHRTVMLKNTALNHHLRELEAERLTLIASVAHELKKPLSVIRLLTGELATDPKANRQTFATQIDGEVSRACRMLDQLITLNQLELGKVSSQRDIDLSETCAEIVEQYRKTHTTHHFRTQIVANIRIKNSIEHIYAILENLLDNAVKHTPAGTIVEIVLARESNRIALHVSDNGGGIATHEQATIIAPFTRAEQAHKIHGHGLGLAIVTHATEHLGGSLTVGNHEEKNGALFTIRIPENR